MWEVVIGNVCSLGAALSDSVSGTRKTKVAMLLWQSLSQCFYIVSSLVLKGYSAVVQNVVAIFRNIYAAKMKKNKAADILLTLIPLILGIYFNNRGFIGVLPVVANLQYNVVMLLFPDNQMRLKISFAVCCSLFVIFNFAILNIVGGFSCLAVVITTVVSIISERKKVK